jgi:NAD-dependent dihydropyrimidine dehydrogenase PreA subunit
MSKTQVALVDKSRCDRSPFCPVMRVCPVKAVTLSSPSEKTPMGGFLGFGGGEITIDSARCTGCGKCVDYCPMGAVRMVHVVKPGRAEATESIS